MTHLLSRKEAAARLGISLQTLDAARNSHRLAYIQHRPNGKVFFTEEALDAYLARCTHQARPDLQLAGVTFRKRRA